MTRHVYRAPLRWSDVDAYQHVNNVQFLRLLEEARVDLLFTRAPGGARAKAAENAILVVRHEIDYLRPLKYRPEPVLIESWVNDVRNAWFSIGYEIRDEDHLYARASTRLACYDLVQNRPRRILTEEREYLARYVEASP